MTGGSRLKTTLIVILILVLIPILFMLFGGPTKVERWALRNPDSGWSEWSMRQLTLYYLITLNPQKRLKIYETYLDNFHEESAAYKPETYKEMYWKYACLASEHHSRGAAGKAFYEFYATFPDDERAERAEDLSKQYGYRPPM